MAPLGESPLPPTRGGGGGGGGTGGCSGRPRGLSLSLSSLTLGFLRGGPAIGSSSLLSPSLSS